MFAICLHLDHYPNINDVNVCHSALILLKSRFSLSPSGRLSYLTIGLRSQARSRLGLSYGFYLLPGLNLFPQGSYFVLSSLAPSVLAPLLCCAVPHFILSRTWFRCCLSGNKFPRVTPFGPAREYNALADLEFLVAFLLLARERVAPVVVTARLPARPLRQRMISFGSKSHRTRSAGAGVRTDPSSVLALSAITDAGGARHLALGLNNLRGQKSSKKPP